MSATKLSKAKSRTANPSAKDYCGIVFIGGGSSWHWASTPQEAATLAAKQCLRDWGRMFKIKGNEVPVNILDMRNRKGWYADHRGIFDDNTNERIEIMEVIKVKV